MRIIKQRYNFKFKMQNSKFKIMLFQSMDFTIQGLDTLYPLLAQFVGNLA